MSKKNCFLGVVLLMTWQLIQAQEYQMIMVSADGKETSIAILKVQDIVFENGAMTVNMKSGYQDKVVGVTSVQFSAMGEIDNNELQSDVFVFPNPVQSYLTVSGIDKNVKINLLDINGRLLQTLFSHENSIKIDVSSLQKGTYFLQVGYKTIKFIKY